MVGYRIFISGLPIRHGEGKTSPWLERQLEIIRMKLGRARRTLTSLERLLNRWRVIIESQTDVYRFKDYFVIDIFLKKTHNAVRIFH